MAEGSQDFSDFEDRLAGMRIPPSDLNSLFHAITLTADENGTISIGTHSKWVGYADEDCRVEIRQSRLVDASHVHLWGDSGQSFVYVLCDDDLVPFLITGGNALVEKSIAERVFAHAIGPRPSYPVGLLGFVGERHLRPGALRRAPNPKMRMAVLKRDGSRCRICGRRPDDNSDIVLHVHHIRPWEKGGSTNPANLITLCHTCHNGLDPHFDVSLFSYVEQDDAITHRTRFEARVANYRRVGFCSTD